MPIVSVLMTSYNREDFIEEAITSVLDSTFTDFELIICDDASSDKTVQIARTFEKKDPRVKVFVNSKNLGDYVNRNVTASYASGKYLKYLDSDDILFPWGLEAMVFCMEKYPKADFGLLAYSYKTNEMLPLLLSPIEIYYNFFFKGSFISAAPSGSIIKRSTFEKIGGFSGEPYVGDFDMWLKLAQQCKMVALPLDLVWWRRHPNQQYVEGIQNNYYGKRRYGIYKGALLDPNCPLPEDIKRTALRNLKNFHSRIVLNDILKGKFKKSKDLYINYELKLIDLFNCFMFNKYPPLQ